MSQQNYSPVITFPGLTPSTDVLCGFIEVTATTSTQTVISIPANRTWSGTLTITTNCAETAAGAGTAQAQGTVTFSNTIAPSTSMQINCRSLAAQNAAGGLTGTQGNNSITVPVVVVAGATGAIVQSSATVSGSFGMVDSIAAGVLL